MKKALLAIFTLFSFIASYGQLNKVTLTDKRTEGIIKNTLRIDSALIPPRVDTNVTRDFGTLVINLSDSQLYRSTGLPDGQQRWVLVGGAEGGSPGATWGVNITGTITNQLDLMTLVNSKQPLLPAGLSNQYWDATGTLQPFPSIPAQINLTSPNGTIIFNGTYPNITAISGITNNNQLTNGSGFITGNQAITLSGDATGSGTTAISVVLANTVTAGSCTLCSLTYDSKGRITIASSGAGSSPVTSVFGRTGAVVAVSGDYTAAQITNAVSTLGTYNDPVWLNQLAWAKILSHPTTIAGYGITDNLVNTFNTRTGAVTLTSGDVTGALTYTPVTNARTLTINGTTFDLTANRTWTISTVGDTTALMRKANNLADVVSISASRLNLGLGTAATKDSTYFLQKALNLSDLGSASSARTNLGLGTAATQNSTVFAQVANNLSDLLSTSTARNNLGFGGKTAGNIAYWGSSNGLHYTPLIYDSAHSQISMAGLGIWFPIGGTFDIQSNVNGSKLSGISYSGTASGSQSFVPFQASVLASQGLLNYQSNSSAAQSGYIFESYNNDAFVKFRSLASNLGAGYAIGERFVSGQNRLAIGWAQGTGYGSGLVNLLQGDSLGNIYLPTAPQTGTTSDLVMMLSGGQIKTLPVASLPGGSGGSGTLTRIGLLDSLTRVSNGLQVLGNSIYAQTANGSFPGLLSSAYWKVIDSISNRTLQAKISVQWSGAGLRTYYTSDAGDIFYGKNVHTANGLSVITQNDSSLLYSPDLNYLVDKTTAQTLTNKTLTSPILTSPRLNTTSTTNYVWTATDALGNGSWQASTGSVTITQTPTKATISGQDLVGADGTNAGLLLPADYIKLHKPFYTDNPTYTNADDTVFYSNGDTLFAKLLNFGNGFIRQNTQTRNGYLLDSSYTRSYLSRNTSGDITMNTSGVFVIGAAKVTNSMLAGSIAYSKLSLTGSIVNGDLAGGIDLPSKVSGILPGANGGTSNGFFAITGPASSLKTFTFPNASATVLTTNALVTVPQGGTGVGTITGIVKGNGTSAFSAAVAGTDYTSGTAALATGILKNTTGTGAHTIAVAADFPTLNQNTSGTAANLSGTPALPNGTTATTQTAGDNTNKLATDNFVSTAITNALGSYTPANIANTDLVQTANRNYSGNNKSISLGTPASPFSGVSLYSTSGFAFQGRLSYSNNASATDANFTIGLDATEYTLPAITANRTITIASGSGVDEIYIWNKNSSAFNWTFSTTVKDAAGNTITKVENQTMYDLVYDVPSSAWIVKSAIGAGNTTAGSSGLYTPTYAAVLNMNFGSASISHWTRQGNEVTVYGTGNIQTGIAGSPSTFSLTLPVPSNITASSDLAGTFQQVNNSGSGVFGTVTGDVTNDVASFQCMSLSPTVGNVFTFSFRYTVK